MQSKRGYVKWTDQNGIFHKVKQEQFYAQGDLVLVEEQQLAQQED